MAENTKKIKCVCKHEFQDEVYGKGIRLHNRTKQSSNVTEWRCTVCLNTKTAGDNKK